MAENNSPWYNYQGEYHKKYPPFSDLTGIEWYDKLKQDIPVIRNNVLSFIKTHQADIKEVYYPGRIEKKKWGAITFMFWRTADNDIINKGKDLFDYFSKIPGFTGLMISILHPQAHIKPHIGDTDAVYRIQIPIDIPAQLPDCGITVGGITKPYKEDDIIVFCDAYSHEVWNNADRPRIVLIMDVVKEEFLPQASSICNTIMLSVRYDALAIKFPFLKVLREMVPNWVKTIISKII